MLSKNQQNPKRHIETKEELYRRSVDPSHCARLLYIHGYLTETEARKVARRITKRKGVPVRPPFSLRPGRRDRVQT